jgi:hypothetical protein
MFVPHIALQFSCPPRAAFWSANIAFYVFNLLLGRIMRWLRGSLNLIPAVPQSHRKMMRRESPD